MDFEILENESPRQKQFREDMEEAGIKLTNYSGRGMFGKETYAVACGGSRYGYENYAPSEQDVYQATKVRLSKDSLGLGTVLYVG
jgi:hypothetical protein